MVRFEELFDDGFDEGTELDFLAVSLEVELGVSFDVMRESAPNVHPYVTPR